MCRSHYVEHAAVVRVGEGETVGGHAHNDRLRVADELAAILTQRLRRMDVARPRFVVRLSHEARHVQLVASRPQHRQGAIRAAHRNGFDELDNFGQISTLTVRTQSGNGYEKTSVRSRSKPWRVTSLSIEAVHGGDFVEREIEAQIAKSEAGVGFFCASDHFEDAGEGMFKIGQGEANFGSKRNTEFSFEFSAIGIDLAFPALEPGVGGKEREFRLESHIDPVKGFQNDDGLERRVYSPILADGRRLEQTVGIRERSERKQAAMDSARGIRRDSRWPIHLKKKNGRLSGNIHAFHFADSSQRLGNALAQVGCWAPLNTPLLRRRFLPLRFARECLRSA